jgi:hypothetical protein
VKILDLTAGQRAIWHNKKNPLCTFLDIRPEVEPDIVCDTTQLPDAVGNGYTLVVFDPPHGNFGAGGKFSKRYGHFTHAQIREQIEKSAKEAHRVTEPNALMSFKWSERALKLETVLGLMSFYWEPLFGDVSKYLNKRSQTHWVLLRRKDIP